MVLKDIVAKSFTELKLRQRKILNFIKIKIELFLKYMLKNKFQPGKDKE